MKKEGKSTESPANVQGDPEGGRNGRKNEGREGEQKDDGENEKTEMQHKKVPPNLSPFSLSFNPDK